jgi:hypothetical protein
MNELRVSALAVESRDDTLARVQPRRHKAPCQRFLERSLCVLRHPAPRRATQARAHHHSCRAQGVVGTRLRGGAPVLLRASFVPARRGRVAACARSTHSCGIGGGTAGAQPQSSTTTAPRDARSHVPVFLSRLRSIYHPLQA